MQKKSSKLNILSVLFLCVLAPLGIISAMKLIESKSYYAAAVIIIICSVVPFFAFFENRKVKTGEIVIIAMMTALCVISRSVMIFIPQVKPTCALVIVTAIAFGGNVGFLTGSLSMFISNFIFGQGMFTPFQMLGMGLVGFIGGILFSKDVFKKNRIIVSITGGILCFFVYGICVDSCSVFMLSNKITLKSVIRILVSGIPFNFIHAVTTSILLLFIEKPMAEKFLRIKIKYGIFEMN